MRKAGIALLPFLVLFSSGCDSNYVYYQPPNPVPHAPTKRVPVAKIQLSSFDMIWQIGGMTELEQTLISGSRSFITQLLTKPADWRIGVISNDVSGPPFLGWSTPFTSQSADPINTFVNAVQTSVSGFDGETMMDPIVQVLKNFPNFVRSASQLVIIVSNDNHDESSATTVTDFLAFLAALKGDLSRVTIYGVIGSTDMGCDPDYIDEDWNYAGSGVQQMIDATHGKAFSLCTADFGTSLSKIGDDIITRFDHPKIYLESRPVVSTISVELLGKVLPPGTADEGGIWTYDYNLNAIVFNDPNFIAGAQDTDQVVIDYQIDDGRPQGGAPAS